MIGDQLAKKEQLMTVGNIRYTSGSAPVYVSAIERKGVLERTMI